MLAREEQVGQKVKFVWEPNVNYKSRTALSVPPRLTYLQVAPSPFHFPYSCYKPISTSPLCCLALYRVGLLEAETLSHTSRPQLAFTNSLRKEVFLMLVEY